MLSFTSNPPAEQQQQQPQQPQQQSHNATQQPPAVQTMRLREDPPPITPAAPRTSRKRKTPPNNTVDQQIQPPQPQPPAPAPPQPLHHMLPPPHALMQPMPAPPGHLPPGYQYADYTPGGLPPNPPPPPEHQQSAPSPQQTAGGRALSNSKRAEQNRKAQRAFRERRDQHVKALESRSQLLDAALASADEANRRWEECRALVDQLRVENAALRAALSQAQLLPAVAAVAAANAGAPPPNPTSLPQAPIPPGSINPGSAREGNNAALPSAEDSKKAEEVTESKPTEPSTDAPMATEAKD